MSVPKDKTPETRVAGERVCSCRRNKTRLAVYWHAAPEIAINILLERGKMGGLITELMEKGVSNGAILILADIIAHAADDDVITLQSISDRRKITNGVPAHGPMNKVRRGVKELCRAGYMAPMPGCPGRFMAADHPKWLIISNRSDEHA